MLATLLLLPACSTLSTYRNTLAVDPPSPPASMGPPVEGATVGGYMTARVTSRDWFNGVGDPGLMVPGTSLGARMRVGMDWIEIGGHFDYSDQSWLNASGVGVLPLADDTPLTGLGAHATVGTMARNVGFGLTVDGTKVFMPYARYDYDGNPNHLGGVAPGDAAPEYELSDAGVVAPIRLRATMAMKLRSGDFEASPALSLCPTFTNVGFAMNPTRIFERGGTALVPTLDLGVWFGDLRIGTQMWSSVGGTVPSGRTGGRLLLDVRAGR